MLIMFSVIVSVDLPDGEMFRLSRLCLPVSLLEPQTSYFPLCSPKAALNQGYAHYVMHSCFILSPFRTPDY